MSKIPTTWKTTTWKIGHRGHDSDGAPKMEARARTCEAGDMTDSGTGTDDGSSSNMDGS
jgi:hypothetical protein